MAKAWYNKRMQKKFARGGFTIVELSLSIVFIAILSLSVVLIMTNAISAYHRGLTLNQVNTTGMELTDDLRAAIQNSPAHSVKSKCSTVYSSNVIKNCENDKARNFVSVARYATVKKKATGATIGTNVPVFGAFCTGSYSYIWNSGYLFSDDYTTNVGGKATFKYREIGGSVADYNKDFKLLKIKDEDRAVCVAATRGGNTGTGNGSTERYYVKTGTSATNSYQNINAASNQGGREFNITGESYNTIEEEPIDLLAGSNNLAVYNIVSSAPAEGSAANVLFYSISFVLGTVQGGINIMESGNYCTTPTDYQNAALENFDYCAINKFNFAAEATGG